MAWPRGKPRKASTAKTDATKPKLKPRPDDWDAPPGADPLAKFKKKNVEWADYSGEDRLHIDQDRLNDLRHEGLVLQWVPTAVYGDTKVVAHMYANHEKNGWVKVDPGDITGINVTQVEDLILMARPTAIDNKARENDRRRNADALNKVAVGLKEGHIPGVTLDARHPSAVRSNKVNRTYERIDIPNEE